VPDATAAGGGRAGFPARGGGGARHPLASPRALVFDLDGLLIRTEDGCFEAARTIVERHALTPVPALTREQYAEFVGEPLIASYTALRERYDLRPGVEQLLVERDEELMSWYLAPRLMPGAEALVTEAHAAGIPLAIATAAPGGLAEAGVKAMSIGPLFDVVVSADHPLVGAPKPAPDIYLAACKLLEVDPADATALEDSPAGCDAALAAGMPTIAVPSEWTLGGEFAEQVLKYESLAHVLAELLPEQG
jgi:pseudouridine 5'-phosphatase